MLHPDLNFEVNSIRRRIYFWWMKRKAIKMHKLTGRRYHVIPVTRKKLVVIDNQFVDRYNRVVKNKANRIRIEDLLEHSYFSTPVEGITRNLK